MSTRRDSRPSRRHHRPAPLVSLAALLVAFAALLRAGDRLPGWIAGVPPGIRVHATLADAERAAGRRLALPSYFPSTLAWPPSAIRSTAPPRALAVAFDGADGRASRLLVCDALDLRSGCAPPLVDPVTPMESREVDLGGVTAHLRRVLDPAGRQLTDIAWSRGARTHLLRFEGPVDQALLMAQSIERSSR